MDAPTQPCGSQQQTEEKTATSAPIQSETSWELECNPSVGEKRTVERSAESEQNTLSNQPPAKRQDVENIAATAIQSFQNNAVRPNQTRIQSKQAYVHTYSPHLSFVLS